jgi:hypothetical protein
MNLLELLLFGISERIYVQKRRDIQNYEVEKWRRVEDPHGNVAL